MSVWDALLAWLDDQPASQPPSMVERVEAEDNTSYSWTDVWDADVAEDDTGRAR